MELRLQRGVDFSTEYASDAELTKIIERTLSYDGIASIPSDVVKKLIQKIINIADAYAGSSQAQMRRDTSMDEHSALYQKIGDCYIDLIDFSQEGKNKSFTLIADIVDDVICMETDSRRLEEAKENKTQKFKVKEENLHGSSVTAMRIFGRGYKNDVVWKKLFSFAKLNHDRYVREHRHQQNNASLNKRSKSLYSRIQHFLIGEELLPPQVVQFFTAFEQGFIGLEAKFNQAAQGQLVEQLAEMGISFHVLPHSLLPVGQKDRPLPEETGEAKGQQSNVPPVVAKDDEPEEDEILLMVRALKEVGMEVKGVITGNNEDIASYPKYFVIEVIGNQGKTVQIAVSRKHFSYVLKEPLDFSNEKFSTSFDASELEGLATSYKTCGFSPKKPNIWAGSAQYLIGNDNLGEHNNTIVRWHKIHPDFLMQAFTEAVEQNEGQPPNLSHRGDRITSGSEPRIHRKTWNSVMQAITKNGSVRGFEHVDRPDEFIFEMCYLNPSLKEKISEEWFNKKPFKQKEQRQQSFAAYIANRDMRIANLGLT